MCALLRFRHTFPHTPLLTLWAVKVIVTRNSGHCGLFIYDDGNPSQKVRGIRGRLLTWVMTVHFREVCPLKRPPLKTSPPHLV